MSCDSSKFSTRLGGTHLPSFLFGVIFTKGERNLKCAHMRLKKPAAPEAKSKRRATMATIVGIRVLFEASHVCKKSGGVSRIHKGSQIKSPIARSLELCSEPFLLFLLLVYQSSHLAWLEWHTCLRQYGEFL